MKEIVNDGFAKVVKPYMDAQDKKSREIIAPVEVSPAEAAHSAGEQIIFNGILYDVIAPIAIDDALSTSGADANISAADNIEAQIKATKSQIQTAAAQAAAQNKNTQEMIAPVEEDETDASRAYAIGDQLILDGVLYNVIDAIAQHGIITSEGAGANIEEADNVTDQLSSLNGALTNEIDKAYQTDDAAITEVASDDLLPIYDTSAAAKKKIAVNNFIGGLVSNPNLLDNPWFTVNQRGQSSYTATTVSKLSFDRWKLAQNDCVISKSSDVITITTSATDYDGLLQTVERDVLKVGKTYTLSVLFSDDTIESRTFTLGSSGTSFLGAWNKNNNLDAVIVSDNNDTAWSIYVFDNKVNGSQSVSFKAVKLELGSVSTLAMDTAPNYATELAKCKASTADSSDTYANQGPIIVAKPVTLNNSIVTSSIGTVNSGNTQLTRWGNLLEFKLSVTGLTIAANTLTTIAEFAGLNEDVSVLMMANANDSTFGIASVEKGTNKIIIKVKFTTAITNGFVLVYGNTILD